MNAKTFVDETAATKDYPDAQNRSNTPATRALGTKGKYRRLLGLALICVGIVDAWVLVQLYCEVQPEVLLCDHAERERQAILEHAGPERDLEKLAKALSTDYFLRRRAERLEQEKTEICERMKQKWEAPSTGFRQFLRYASYAITFGPADSIMTRARFTPGLLEVVASLFFGIMTLRSERRATCAADTTSSPDGTTSPEMRST